MQIKILVLLENYVVSSFTAEFEDAMLFKLCVASWPYVLFVTSRLLN